MIQNYPNWPLNDLKMTRKWPRMTQNDPKDQNQPQIFKFVKIFLFLIKWKIWIWIFGIFGYAIFRSESKTLKFLNFKIQHYLPEMERNDIPATLRGHRNGIISLHDTKHTWHHHKVTLGGARESDHEIIPILEVLYLVIWRKYVTFIKIFCSQIWNDQNWEVRKSLRYFWNT